MEKANAPDRFQRFIRALVFGDRTGFLDILFLRNGGSGDDQGNTQSAAAPRFSRHLERSASAALLACVDNFRLVSAGLGRRHLGRLGKGMARTLPVKVMRRLIRELIAKARNYIPVVGRVCC